MVWIICVHQLLMHPVTNTTLFLREPFIVLNNLTVSDETLNQRT
jgi:hypothetical protein